VEAFKPIPEHYNYATLPRGVPRDVPKIEPAQVASGTGSVKIEVCQPEYRRVRVELEKPDRLLFRTSNYPGWTALVDGKVTEIKTGEAGMIVVDLPAGAHEITLDFRATRVRRISVWITLISSVLLLTIGKFQLKW